MTHSAHRPLGGKVVTKPFIFFGFFFGIALYFLVRRFVFGLDETTNLNGGYPWGIWAVVDVVIGTAFGCGGFAMALLVYIFNRNRFHALMRPALLGGLFGYTLGSPAWRRNQRLMFLGAVLLLGGGALYRINAYLVAYEPGNGWTYFPSVPELMVTVGVIALEIMLYLWFVKRLPVLQGPAEAAQPGSA